MRRADVQQGTCVFRLPPLVDGRALDPVMEYLAADPFSACVLDFDQSTHIRFRDFERFIRRIGAMEARPRPILLAGLSAYCEEIVRFVLGVKDWDLFRVVLELAWEEPAESGFARAIRRVEGSGGSLRQVAPAALCPPCPN